MLRALVVTTFEQFILDIPLASMVNSLVIQSGIWGCFHFQFDPAMVGLILLYKNHIHIFDHLGRKWSQKFGSILRL